MNTNPFRLKHLKRFEELQHRSGWNKVLESLFKFHSPYALTLLDDSVDQAFYNNYRSGRPEVYNFPWVGFFHCNVHLTSPFPVELGLENIFQLPEFKDSLPYCKGLYTLSQYLQRGVKDLLNGMEVPVEAILHPTETDVPRFNYGAFRSNPRVLQVGYWMRNLDVFHQLKSPHPKYAILSKHVVPAVLDYVKVLRQDKSVTYMEYQENHLYDQLLQDCVVFLNLHDTSANNAIIECIARGTPILVNKHPAAMEYLGEDYPLFYSSLEEAERKLRNNPLLLYTHNYLLSSAAQSRISFKTFESGIARSHIAIACSPQPVSISQVT